MWQGKTVEEPATGEGVCVVWMGHGTRAVLGDEDLNGGRTGCHCACQPPTRVAGSVVAVEAGLLCLGDGGGRWLFRMDRRRPGWDMCELTLTYLGSGAMT